MIAPKFEDINNKRTLVALLFATQATLIDIFLKVIDETKQSVSLKAVFWTYTL